MNGARLAAPLAVLAPAVLAACGALWSYDDYTDQPRAGTAGAGGHVTPVICVAAYRAESFRSRCQQPNDGVQWNPYVRSFAMVPSGGFTSW